MYRNFEKAKRRYAEDLLLLKAAVTAQDPDEAALEKKMSEYVAIANESPFLCITDYSAGGDVRIPYLSFLADRPPAVMLDKLKKIHDRWKKLGLSFEIKFDSGWNGGCLYIIWDFPIKKALFELLAS